jgi:dTDP-4-amino-4,6-dideoxygalactose transaminase
LRVPTIPNYIEHAAYKCYVFVKGGVELRNKMMLEINEKGVPCYSGSCSEVYLEKAFDNTGFRPKERLPVARELGDTSLMFLVHPTLTNVQIQKTCDVLIEVAVNNYDG